MEKIIQERFMANDGKMKLKAMLPTHSSSEIHSGKLQNLGLISILDYTCNAIPNQPGKVEEWKPMMKRLVSFSSIRRSKRCFVPNLWERNTMWQNNRFLFLLSF
ncbi:uncharacterized protein LOC131225807 [Magnolia sinica]|uniref:uncharacterized protein LOC131225807 n=1 Tax=Magnolia sinica TaxID=86752 RepID=UPI002658FDAB|nr:uncharacterized protein LOC131225807 [Magnolia sinica]